MMTCFKSISTCKAPASRIKIPLTCLASTSPSLLSPSPRGDGVWKSKLCVPSPTLTTWTREPNAPVQAPSPQKEDVLSSRKNLSEFSKSSTWMVAGQIQTFSLHLNKFQLAYGNFFQSVLLSLQIMPGDKRAWRLIIKLLSTPL